MADKAEKDLDQASDCGWVRGLDANGNPIKLNKADMVELIRANMPVATMRRIGLADAFVNPEYHTIPANATIEIPVNDYGFYSISSHNLEGTSCIVMVSYYKAHTIELLGSISSLVKIQLKGDGIKTLVITSLTDSENRVIVNRI